MPTGARLKGDTLKLEVYFCSLVDLAICLALRDQYVHKIITQMKDKGAVERKNGYWN